MCVLRKKTSPSKAPPAWIKNPQKWKQEKRNTTLNLLFQNFLDTFCTNNEECDKLRSIFWRLDYTITLIYYTIFKMFIQNIATKLEGKTDDGNTIRTVLLFKDQIAARSP